eukprot:6174150-Pleurochrysis_carterae.AAC.4
MRECAGMTDLACFSRGIFPSSDARLSFARDARADRYGNWRDRRHVASGRWPPPCSPSPSQLLRADSGAGRCISEAESACAAQLPSC